MTSSSSSSTSVLGEVEAAFKPSLQSAPLDVEMHRAMPQTFPEEMTTTNEAPKGVTSSLLDDLPLSKNAKTIMPFERKDPDYNSQAAENQNNDSQQDGTKGVQQAGLLSSTQKDEISSTAKIGTTEQSENGADGDKTKQDSLQLTEVDVEKSSTKDNDEEEDDNAENREQDKTIEESKEELQAKDSDEDNEETTTRTKKNKTKRTHNERDKDENNNKEREMDKDKPEKGKSKKSEYDKNDKKTRRSRSENESPKRKAREKRRKHSSSKSRRRSRGTRRGVSRSRSRRKSRSRSRSRSRSSRSRSQSRSGSRSRKKKRRGKTKKRASKSRSRSPSSRAQHSKRSRSSSADRSRKRGREKGHDSARKRRSSSRQRNQRSTSRSESRERRHSEMVKPKAKVVLVASYGTGEEDDPIVINDTEWEPAVPVPIVVKKEPLEEKKTAATEIVALDGPPLPDMSLYPSIAVALTLRKDKKLNLDAPHPPKSSDDLSEGYGVGSLWLTGQVTYVCLSAIQHKAVWSLLSVEDLGVLQKEVELNKSEASLTEAAMDLDSAHEDKNIKASAIIQNNEVANKRNALGMRLPIPELIAKSLSSEPSSLFPSTPLQTPQQIEEEKMLRLRYQHIQEQLESVDLLKQLMQTEDSGNGDSNNSGVVESKNNVDRHVELTADDKADLRTQLLIIGKQLQHYDEQRKLQQEQEQTSQQQQAKNSTQVVDIWMDGSNKSSLATSVVAEESSAAAAKAMKSSKKTATFSSHVLTEEEDEDSDSEVEVMEIGADEHPEKVPVVRRTVFEVDESMFDPGSDYSSDHSTKHRKKYKSSKNGKTSSSATSLVDDSLFEMPRSQKKVKSSHSSAKHRKGSPKETNKDGAETYSLSPSQTEKGYAKAASSIVKEALKPSTSKLSEQVSKVIMKKASYYVARHFLEASRPYSFARFLANPSRVGNIHKLVAKYVHLFTREPVW